MNQRKWLVALLRTSPLWAAQKPAEVTGRPPQWIAMARRAPVMASTAGGMTGVVSKSETNHLVPINADLSTGFST